MQLETREYNLWVIVQPAPDVAGQWVAHCLELDVVTQGESLRHAFQMAAEAAGLVVVDDLNSDRDPLERRAPPEFWTQLGDLILNSTPHRLDAIDEASIEIVAGQIHIVAFRARPDIRVEVDVPYVFSPRQPEGERACG